MGQLYYLEKNTLSPEEMDAILAHIDNNLEDDHRDHYQHAGFSMWDLYRSDGLEYKAMRKIIKLCYDTFTKNYNFKYNRFELKRFFGNVMHPGAVNEAHDDDGDVYPDKPDIEEHYSAILMLTDNYSGGELFFQHHGVSIRLDAGDLIMFRGNAANLHGVTEVLSGKRSNIIIFFRNRPVDHEINDADWDALISD